MISSPPGFCASPFLSMATREFYYHRYMHLSQIGARTSHVWASYTEALADKIERERDPGPYGFQLMTVQAETLHAAATKIADRWGSASYVEGGLRWTFLRDGHGVIKVFSDPVSV